MLARVILAVDKSALLKELRNAIKDPDVTVEGIRGKHKLWDRLSRESADLLIISHRMIPDPAINTVKTFCELPDAPGVVVITGIDHSDIRADLLTAGCEAVLDETMEAGQIAGVVARIIERREQLHAGHLLGRRPLSQPGLDNFVAFSPAMQAFMSTVRRVIPSSVPLLILGETGAGKERLARVIHSEGPRSGGPFVTVNCGALPESLLESELFGHEEGAFTGATRARRGMFEMAHRGTLFLDEIGEMPFHLQVKLLRAVLEHEVQRVGGERSLHVDVRIMAATNRDLEEEIRERRFRKDLYYRLSVVTLTLPPLRERLEDIPYLAESYLEYFRPTVGREVNSIHPEAMDALIKYAWPGNVRELMNVIERAMLLCSDDEITLDDLPQMISCRPFGRPSRTVGVDGWMDFSRLPDEWLEKPFRRVRAAFVSELERGYITALLRRTGGRIGETARLAGMEPRSLYEKMRRHRLRKEQFKGGSSAERE